MKDELREALKEKKIIFGVERTLKKLREGKLKKIFLASNCPEKIKETIKYYANLTNSKVVELETSNEELSIICKKPFFISVLSY